MAVVSPMLATNDADGWSTVLAGRIHTATPKDLLIGVSLETSLLTDTLVKSSGGTKDTSTAEAGIEVKVLVDGSEAAPGVVVFDKRKQQLSASLGGYYTNCVDGSNGGILDGIIDVTMECELASEEIDLLLETTAAHHFNFIQADLGQGVHDVVVKAKISNNSVSANGSASASALLGNGSLSIEEVQAVNSPDGIVLQ
ncbi:hypothetical protein [Geomonas subterranea]|uniref:Uncharacterized protein n=1 Tax=Geomonas subterranea TaxID=2847989 RepID=A0ABX8LQ37_9BACT|nr:MULTISPECIES: hypothetical protein [Geomonas]QXE92409.1 hypothetical protein KP001_07765 [Geomonas subterranea]QXM09492.1 hypothetical protein KP002_21505 [Geomonas subterranea]